MKYDFLKKMMDLFTELRKKIENVIQQNKIKSINFTVQAVSCLFLVYLIIKNWTFFYSYSESLLTLNAEAFVFLTPIGVLFLLILANSTSASRVNTLTGLSILLAIVTFFIANHQKTIETQRSLRALNALNCETAKELNTTSTDTGRINIKYVTEPYTDKEILNYLFNERLISQNDLEKIFGARNQMELSNIVTDLRLAKSLSTDQSLSINNQIQNFASIVSEICEYR